MMLKNLAKRACVAAAGVVLAACPPNPVAPHRPEMGSFVGVRNGATWTGRAYAVLRDDTLTLVAHRPAPDAFHDEYVEARVRFTGAGIYLIPESAGRLSEITGGDAGVVAPAGGSMVIQSYDRRTETVTGEISLTASSMDPAWFTHGSFEAPIFSRFDEVPPAR